MKIKDIATKVKELAAEHPSVTYKNNGALSQYTRGTSIPGMQGCAIGIAIQMLDPEKTEALGVIDRRKYGISFAILCNFPELQIETDYYDTDLMFLLEFQRLQDSSRPWSQCSSMAFKWEKFRTIAAETQSSLESSS